MCGIKAELYFDFHVTFNENPDHKGYSRIYTQHGIPRLTAVVFGKNILITTAGLWEFIFGLALRLCGCSISHVIHDWSPHPGRKRLLTVVYNFFAKKVFQIVVHSRAQSVLAGGAPFFFLPFELAGVAKEEIPAGLRLLAFGRNESYKNFKFLLHPEILSSGVEVVIVSRGLELSQVTPSPNLTLVDRLSCEAELNEFIDWCDLVVLPYTSATQSGVIVKSFSRCRPVAVSSLPGLVEYVTDDHLGVCFEVGSAQSFLHSIEKFRRRYDPDGFFDALAAHPGNVVNLFSA